VSRVPIRIQLTAAFAVAMVVVLAAAGAFVYLRLEADLNESIAEGLRTRLGAVLAAGSPSAGAAGDEEEGFAQLLRPDGSVLAGGGTPVLTRAELRRVAAGEQVVGERRVPGVEGIARVLARRDVDGTIGVVGQSLQDRDETLDSVVVSFAIGGPVAVALASLLGYLLAAAGLWPVEEMRRRARDVTLSGGAERLPLPAAQDEIRRLGETLNEMLDRLRASFERERRFVADASHELRTPVAVIKTELEGALRAGGHDPQVEEALIASLEECDHLAQMAEDLLVVARTTEGGIPLRRESLDVPELVARVVARFADRARQRDRTVVADVAGITSVDADELRLRQALGNLVDNALRYGRGTVTVRAARGEGGAEFAVSDEGEGFDPSFAARAFERFARGDGARGREGTGLGLSIVRAIAEAHGGRAEAVLGPGGSVRVWIPDGARPASGPSQVAGVVSTAVHPTPGGEDR
jgi:signal transduction histidine kinase